jgi:hypothetical protein
MGRHQTPDAADPEQNQQRIAAAAEQSDRQRMVAPDPLCQDKGILGTDRHDQTAADPRTLQEWNQHKASPEKRRNAWL